MKPKNAHLPDSVLAFKEQRKGNTVVSTWTGGVVGLVALGPFGAAAGAGIAYGVSKSVGKNRERKLIQQCQCEQYPSRITTTARPARAMVVRHDEEPRTDHLPELT